MTCADIFHTPAPVETITVATYRNNIHENVTRKLRRDKEESRPDVYDSVVELLCACRGRLTQLVGLMAAVHSAVGMNLEVEADANPAVEPAGPASRADPLLKEQRGALRCGRGANPVSEGQKAERNIHSSQQETLTTPRFAF